MPLQHDAQVQVAEAVQDGLVLRRVVLDAHAGVLGHQAVQAPPTASARRRASRSGWRGRAWPAGTRPTSGDSGPRRASRAAPRRSAISSILGTAQMSPGTACVISTWSLPCSWNRCAILIGLRASPTSSCAPGRTVPWCTRKMPSLPTNGSIVTLNTCATTCFAGSGLTGHALRGVAFALQERRRIALGRIRHQPRQDLQQLRQAGAGLAPNRSRSARGDPRAAPARTDRAAARA